jgi:hypothetical protein
LVYCFHVDYCRYVNGSKSDKLILKTEPLIKKGV